MISYLPPLLGAVLIVGKFVFYPFVYFLQGHLLLTFAADCHLYQMHVRIRRSFVFATFPADLKEGRATNEWFSSWVSKSCLRNGDSANEIQKVKRLKNSTLTKSRKVVSKCPPPQPNFLEFTVLAAPR